MVLDVLVIFFVVLVIVLVGLFTVVVSTKVIFVD